MHRPNEFVRDVKADKSSFKLKGLQQLTHSNKLEKMEPRVTTIFLGQESSEKPSWRHTRRRRNYRNDLRNRFRGSHTISKKHRNLVFNLDSSLSSCRTPLLVQSLRAQEAGKKLVAERLDIEKLLKKRAHLLYKSSP